MATISLGKAIDPPDRGLYLNRLTEFDGFIDVELYMIKHFFKHKFVTVIKLQNSVHRPNAYKYFNDLNNDANSEQNRCEKFAYLRLENEQ